MSWLYGLIGVAAAAAPAVAPPKPAPGRWIVDWGEQRCSLVRETGGVTPVSLMVRTVPGARQAELWLLDPKWRGPVFSSWKPFEIFLQPSGFQVTAQALSVSHRGQKGIGVTNIDEGFLKNLPGSASVRIENDGRPIVSVELPGSARAVAALRQCEATVLRDWGLDPAVIASLRRPPEPIESIPGRFRDDDYPTEAILAQQSGSVLVRLTIEVDGRVGECAIVESSGAALLDQRTCQVIVRRGRYRPALDASGAPVRALAAIRISWVLPN
jgi:TonB family protein